jgi:hypothetical protein
LSRLHFHNRDRADVQCDRQNECDDHTPFRRWFVDRSRGHFVRRTNYPEHWRRILPGTDARGRFNVDYSHRVHDICSFVL